MSHNCPCDCHYADSGALICSACLGNHRPGDEADEDENDDAILELDTCVFNRHPDVEISLRCSFPARLVGMLEQPA
jgi:hypothetical protein